MAQGFEMEADSDDEFLASFAVGSSHHEQVSLDNRRISVPRRCRVEHCKQMRLKRWGGAYRMHEAVHRANVVEACVEAVEFLLPTGEDVGAHVYFPAVISHRCVSSRLNTNSQDGWLYHHIPLVLHWCAAFSPHIQYLFGLPGPPQRALGGH